MRTVVIVRGLPGSGKSTLAREISDRYASDLPANIHPMVMLCSTDNYFMHDGVYKFDGRQLTQAHEWNKNNFDRAIRNDYHLVIVDNTNTQFWEMAAYIEGAINNGYDLEIAEPHTEWAWDIDELFERNTHGVPREAIERMFKRWDYAEELATSIEEKYGVKADYDVDTRAITVWNEDGPF